MRTLIHFICVLIIFSVLVSCSNALYFYETDKISLTAEVRPDSSQPVQGNFGLKQRIALITPPKSDGEALSVITSFRFKKHPGGGAFDIGPVSIKTAFITGEAAANNGNAVGAATAIVGATTVKNSGVDISVMRNIVSLIEEDKDNTQAVKLLGQLNALGKVIIPDNYTVTIYGAIPRTSFFELQALHNINTKISLPRDINGVLTYWGQLNGSFKTLKSVLKTPHDYLFNSQIPSGQIITSVLNEELTSTETEILKVRRELINNSIYSQTIQFYIDNYL